MQHSTSFLLISVLLILIACLVVGIGLAPELQAGDSDPVFPVGVKDTTMVGRNAIDTTTTTDTAAPDSPLSLWDVVVLMLSLSV